MQVTYGLRIAEVFSVAVKVVEQPEQSRSPVLKGEIFHIVWQAANLIYRSQ